MASSGLAQAAGHAQEEVLRGLDDLAGLGVAQQVAVVDGAQAEELEALVAVVSIAALSSGRGRSTNSKTSSPMMPTAWPSGDRLGEPRDVLVADFLVDVGREQAGGQLGVVGLLDDVGRRSANGEFIEFDRGGTVVQTTDRARGHSHGSTPSRPSAHRWMRVTIFIGSTGSKLPSRLRTRIFGVGNVRASLRMVKPLSWFADVSAVVSVSATVSP